MRRILVSFSIILLLLISAFTAFPSVKYAKVASFKDIGQNRVFFIALKDEIPSNKLEKSLWEIVDYYMERYGQAPQMWIYFFDNKKFTPSNFPIEGTAIDHLIAEYFYATDTRTKELKILTKEDLEEIKKVRLIKSPLWEGQ